MSGIVQQPQVFTHGEWKLNNTQKYTRSDLERREAQGLQDECDRLIDETAKRTERTLKDVNKKIEQRINEVKYWKSEVNKKLDDATKETDALNNSFIRLKQAFDATEEPLHIAQQCIRIRQERKGIDRVHDPVQQELCKECEVYKGVQQLLHNVMEQTKEQLRLNRKAIYDLKQNSAAKLTAQQIDEFARSLRETDESLPTPKGNPRIPFFSLTPDQWKSKTDLEITQAEKQLHNSQKLRGIIDGILAQVAADQRRQVEDTNRALDKRISETRSAKAKLEEHLAKVLEEISKIEDTIQDLKKAIKDKEGPLRLAHTRTDIRDTRPLYELCKDPANYRLLQEINELTNDIAELNHRLRMAENSLQALCRQQLDLEEEIQIKAATLFIDEVQCKGTRESLIIRAF